MRAITSAKSWYRQVSWFKLALLILGFVVLSLGLGYGMQYLLARFELPLAGYEGLAYLVVFGVSLVVNASVLPVPFAISIMVAAAEKWNPLLVALAGSVGGSLGELTGYYLGYLGKKVAMHDQLGSYQTVRQWVKKYDLWAIAFLSFQPVIPVELGGLAAGAIRMPIPRFLLGLWIGKYPKYILLIYAGLELVGFLPGLFS